jgi:hypothetical protein
MKLKYYGVLLAGLISNRAFAQADFKSRFPEADAVYKNLSCDVNIKKEDGKFIATTDHSEDLIYLNPNAVSLMNRGYIYHSSFNELKKWDAYTQLPDEKKKLKTSNTSTKSNRQDYIFYDDVKSTSFEYGGATVGATRHLDYQIQNNDVYLLSPYYFERYFPVAEGELRITFPSDVKLKYIIKGLNAGKIKFSESKKKDKTTYTFHVSDIKGVLSYPDAPDNSYYATHIIFFIEQTKENGEWKNFLSSPDDLYRHSYEYIKNVNKEASEDLKKITDSLTHTLKTDIEKAKQIYKWVQSNIKYVAFEEGMEGFIPRNASLVCSRRFGDCKDMASILTLMLIYSKIPAYFTWIGTRDIPYDYTEVPLPIVDNHMICTARIGDEYIFLDGTDEGCIFGMPSSGIQGKQAMISINEKEYKIIRVPVMPKEKNIVRDSTFLELTEKQLTGKIKVELEGYYASQMHSVVNFKTEEERNDYFKNYFARGSNKINFSNWEFNENPEHTKVVITAGFELPDYAKKLGDEWFLNLNLFKFYEHKEIDFPKRKTPIEFSFLKHSSYVTMIKIPDGFKLSYSPKTDAFKNDVWGYVMDYSLNKDQVCLRQEFDTNQLLLYPEQFEQWNKVLEHLFPNYKQTISFQKK